MVRNKILKQVILTVFGITILLTVYLYITTDKPEPEQNEGLTQYLSEIIYGFYTNEALPVGNMQLFRGINRNDTINLNNLAATGVLVFRFSGETCNICVDFALDKLKKAFPDFSENDNIVLLSSQIADRLKEKYFGKAVYSFIYEEQELPFDKYQIPYFFYMDCDLEYKLFFIPEASMPKLTDFYLKNMSERFMKK